MNSEEGLKKEQQRAAARPVRSTKYQGRYSFKQQYKYITN